MRASRSRRPIIHVWRPSPEQERYAPDMIAESLGRSSWDRDPVLLDVDRAARVLLIPAFDPEGMLTATRAGSATTIRVDAFSHSLWYSLNIPSGDASTDVGGPAVPWTAETTVRGERSDELWKAWMLPRTR